MESSTFLPIIVEAENLNICYLAVLLGKWNMASYSRKDKSLLDTISVNMAHIVEAEELRRERRVIEEEFQRQKESAIKEIHDGLGNILSCITVASQVAERTLSNDMDRAKEMVERVGRYSLEAMDFMRTGLTVLDNAEGNFGQIMESMRARFGELLSAYGIEMSFNVSDEVVGIKAGANINLNIIRSIQEAMNNAIKHSGAKKVEIIFSRDGDNLRVNIKDNGNGLATIKKAKGMGLKNISKRAREMGGYAEIQSSPQIGTNISLLVPLNLQPIAINDGLS